MIFSSLIGFVSPIVLLLCCANTVPQTALWITMLPAIGGIILGVQNVMKYGTLEISGDEESTNNERENEK